MGQKEPGYLEMPKTSEEEQYLFDIRVLGDYISDGICIADSDANILYVNDANARITSVPKQVAIGSNIRDNVKNGLITSSVALRPFQSGEQCMAIFNSSFDDTQAYEVATPIKRDGRMLGVVIVDHELNDMVSTVENMQKADTEIIDISDLPRLHNMVVQRLNSQNDIENVARWASEEMKEVEKHAYLASQADVPVLITGETGTGKEVIANLITQLGARREQPFIKVNCAAIPPQLLESEMFGYERGAFTGADPKGKVGLFELANRGTLMLDEIGDLPLDFQTKLLRAIQQKTIQRVGGTVPIELDIRFISSTNRDLEQMIQEGTFRQDLYYRINVFPIHIPPLRERPADIEALLKHFISVFNKKYKKNVRIGRDVIAELKTYPWPGNIRELENIVERWCVISDSHAVVKWDAVAAYFKMDSEAAIDFEGKTLSETMEEHEKEVLQWAFGRYASLREMGKALGIDSSNLSRKARKYGISRS